MDDFDEKMANMDYKLILKLVRMELKDLNDYIEFHQKKEKEKDNGNEEGYDFGFMVVNATIISLIILLETNLRDFLEDYQENKNSKISFKDFRGDILKKFKLYSQKVLELKFDFESDLWQYIQGLNELRNCLIHNDGWLDDFNNRKAIEDFTRREKSLTIDKYETVNISYETCKNAIIEMDRFFTTICKIGITEFPGEYDIENEKGYILPITD